MRSVWTLAGALILLACELVPGLDPDLPLGPPTPKGVAATGPIIVLGSGMIDNLGWRLSVYESVDGWCRQLEVGRGAVGACGDPPGLAPGELIRVEGGGSGRGEPDHWTGVVTAEAAQLWLEAESDQRFAGTLLELKRAGFEDMIFVVFVPAGTAVRSLIASDGNGEIIDQVDPGDLRP